MNAQAIRQVLADWHPRLSRISEQDAQAVVGTKWTRKQVLGHLIDSAANNHQRFVRLQQGNLAGFPGYEQEEWVDAGQYNSSSWTDLLALWYSYNRQLAVVVEHIDPSHAGHVWEDKSLTLEFIIQDYTRHILHHMAQLA